MVEPKTQTPQVKKKSTIRKIVRVVGKVILFFFIFSLVQVIAGRWIPIYYTPLMAIRKWEAASAGAKDKTIHYRWKPLEEISDYMPLAVVASEDQKFLMHRGLDFDAIEKAMEYNKKHKKKRGASTITQQVAKNVFLWNGRNYLRKGLEVYYTFLIEIFWGKERIMEVYLNVAETGERTFGVEAAAQRFFNKPASKLNKNECALIAASLPNPIKYSVNKPSSIMLQKRNWILKHMNKLGGKSYLKDM